MKCTSKSKSLQIIFKKCMKTKGKGKSSIKKRQLRKRIKAKTKNKMKSKNDNENKSRETSLTNHEKKKNAFSFVGKIIYMNSEGLSGKHVKVLEIGQTTRG